MKFALFYTFLLFCSYSSYTQNNKTKITDMNLIIHSFYKEGDSVYIDSIEISAQFNQLSNTLSIDLSIGYIDSVKWCISYSYSYFIWYSEQRAKYAINMNEVRKGGITNMYVINKNKVVFIESLKNIGTKLRYINYIQMIANEKKDKWLIAYYKNSKKLEDLITPRRTYDSNRCND
jgi:hypothetical protein